MWNTDGIPVFKSSGFALWPLYLVINEIPYKERISRDNMIFASLRGRRTKGREGEVECEHEARSLGARWGTPALTLWFSPFRPLISMQNQVNCEMSGCQNHPIRITPYFRGKGSTRKKGSPISIFLALVKSTSKMRNRCVADSDHGKGEKRSP